MTLDDFRAEYRLYQSGTRDEAPAMDGMDEADRHAAERWLSLFLADERGLVPPCRDCGIRRSTCVACGR